MKYKIAIYESILKWQRRDITRYDRYLRREKKKNFTKFTFTKNISNKLINVFLAQYVLLYFKISVNYLSKCKEKKCPIMLSARPTAHMNEKKK